MAEDERLREALLELRGDLSRATAAADQAEALLQLSEALAGAAGRQKALKVLVAKTAALLGEVDVAVVEQGDGSLSVATSTRPIGQTVELPIDPTLKPRNFLDLTSLKAWSAFHDATGWTSLLISPLEVDGERGAAILCGHRARAVFKRSDAGLLRRISRFASQTLTQLALSSQTQLLGAVIDGSSSGFAISDARHAGHPLIFVNKAFEDLTGYTSEEVLGQNCRLLSAEPPDSDERQRLRAAVAKNASGRFLLRNKRKSGEPFWNELTLFPVQGAGGGIEYLVATQTDATERVRAREERDRVKEQEAMAQLAAGIAHDFNNLLSAINGSALLISTDPKVTPEIDTHAARISQAGGRAAKLVSRMLDLGAQRGDYHVFALQDPVRESIDLARSSLGDGISLVIDMDPTPCPVLGSTTEITQILVNLMLNARDAMDGDGQIQISLRRPDTLPAATDVGSLTPGGSYVALIVEDTGHGMSLATMGQVFEPYFSTKGDKGKGIGLSMVATLIKKLGAAIKVSSQPGMGTTFAIWFPLVDAEAAPDEADLSMLSGKTILIVDDEPEAAQVLSSYLDRLGAEPSILTAPDLALEILAEDHAEWDVLITDYDMPQMSGGDLVAAVRRHTTMLPIYVVTALARRLDDRRLENGAISRVFEKPLDLPRFAATLACDLAASERSDETTSG